MPARSRKSISPSVRDNFYIDQYIDLYAEIGKCNSTGKEVKICYNLFGSKKNPCILLVQGIGTSLLGFPLPFISMLVDAGYCVVRYDNRDTGLSTSFKEFSPPSLVRYVIPEWASIGERVPYTLNDMMNDGMRLLTYIGIEKAHMFGLSMGGMIVQLMAIHHPERVLSLNILFSHMGGNDHVEPPYLNLLHFLKKPKNDSCEEKIKIFREFMVFLGQNQYAFDPDELQIFFETVIARDGTIQVGEPRHVSAIMRAPSRKKDLQKITCPTLVMHGMLDPLIPVENGYQLAKTIPNAKLVLFPRLGHMFPPQLYSDIAERVIFNAQRAS